MARSNTLGKLSDFLGSRQAYDVIPITYSYRMGTTLSLIFRRLATKFLNLVQKKNPPVAETAQGFKDARHLTSYLSQQLRTDHQRQAASRSYKIIHDGLRSLQVSVVHKRPIQLIANATDSANHFSVKLSLFICMLAACSGSPPQCSTFSSNLLADH